MTSDADELRNADEMAADLRRSVESGTTQDIERHFRELVEYGIEERQTLALAGLDFEPHAERLTAVVWEVEVDRPERRMNWEWNAWEALRIIGKVSPERLLQFGDLVVERCRTHRYDRLMPAAHAFEAAKSVTKLVALGELATRRVGAQEAELSRTVFECLGRLLKVPTLPA